MDSEQLRETLRAISGTACPFEKAILAHHCGCSQAEGFCIAERPGVQCRSGAARDRCVRLLAHLGQQARFALRLREGGTAWSHAKGMRLQVGGLRGLRRVLAPDLPIPQPIADVFALVDKAEALYPGLADLPLALIVREIAAYRGRVPFRERKGR